MIQTETIVGMMNNRKKNMYGIYTCEMGQYHDSKRYMLHACFVEQEAAKEYACFLRRKGFFSREDIIVIEVSASFSKITFFVSPPSSFNSKFNDTSPLLLACMLSEVDS